MKISSLSYINNQQNTKRTTEAKNKTQKSEQYQTSMPKHSMAEVLGRSQIVSFNGTNKVNGTKFIHDCSDSNGKEKIVYDRETGIFSHITYSHSGKLIRQEEFDPKNQTEYLTSVEQDGTRIETKKTLNDETTIVKNPKGQTTDYIYKNLITGEIHEEITEYDIGRRIINDTVNGRETTQVIDLRTNMFVNSGPLVIRERMDESSDTCITENLITKTVLKEEEFDKKGRIVRSTEYSENRIKIKEGILTATGAWKEKTFSAQGVLEKITTTSKDNRNVRVSEFNVDGNREVKRYEINYNKDGSIDYELLYLPNIKADIIQEEINYDDKYGNEYTVYQYNTNPERNVVSTAQVFRKGRVVEDHIYRPDGKVRKQIIEHKDNGYNIKIDLYGSKEKKYQVEVYKPNGFLSKIEQYNPQAFGEKLVKEIFFNEETGVKTEVSYNDKGKKQHVIFKDNNGNRIKETEFYADGKTPKTFTKYNPDGSYSQTTYDELGQEITTNKFDRDGNQIPKNKRRTNPNEDNGYQNTNSQRDYYTDQERHRRAERHSSTQRTQATNIAPETDGEFISRITDLCAQKKFSTITDTDWSKLASILGTDADTIKNLDHDHYKKLAIKFHPDINSSEHSHNLTCILNALNEKNKK